MLHVYAAKTYAASINKQHAAADTYEASLPCLLLLADGRVRRFPSMAEAKDEAQKRWAPCSFSRQVATSH